MLIRRWLLAPLVVALLTLFALPLWAQDDDVEVEEPPEATAEATGGEDESTDAESGPAPDMEKQLMEEPGIYAPAVPGYSGLVWMATTDVGVPHTFRVALQNQLFSGTSFLVTNDDHSRYHGTLSINYTPIRFLEFYLSFASMANSNTRPPETDRLDQEVILALGDLSLGGKGQYKFAPYIGVGGNFEILFLNAVGGVSPEGSATGFYIGAYSTFDLDPLANFPLRFHLNIGYRLDNSNELATFTNYSLASLQVEKHSLGIKPSRVQLKFGMDLPLRKYIGSFGLTPIFEMNADFATDDADPDFMKFVGNKLTQEEIDGATTMWLTLGARTNPVRGFNFLLAFDIGAVPPGYGYGPPVLPWNVILGFSYSYYPKPYTKTVEKEKLVVKTVAPQPRVGKLRGRVINAKSLEPVEGAVVTFPGKDLTGLSTDPDGTFLTYEMPPGTHPVMVRHPDYLPGKVMASIKIGAVSAQDIKVEPAPPKVGKLSGRVQNLKGAGVAATISATGPEPKEATADASGSFSLELKPGSYNLQFSADGYLRKVKPITIAAGGQFNADITLSPKPRRSLVRITRRSILIRRKVHFATGTADIKPDSRQLLDAVVHVLLENPQIKHVEIQGHTDNRGGQAMNMRLSQSRADSVKTYLVQNGIDTDRLTTKGYGPSRPKVPNIGARNRAKNRRVEFRILKQ